MPVVNDDLVTAADNLEHKCPKCEKWFKDFILFMCQDCEKKGWYEIILNPKWFPKKLEDGTPDWNSHKKDKTLFSKDWSYGRLNIETMEMERVPIHRSGKKWDYETFNINGSEIEEEVINAVRNSRMKTKKEIKEKEKQERKEQKEVMKLIDKK